MKTGFTLALALCASALAGLLLTAVATAQVPTIPRWAPDRSTMLALRAANIDSAASTGLDKLLAEAIENNPAIKAARKEQEAAARRVAPAGALDDPMLEAGFLNLPATSPSFTREDMTMKMLGISQRLPYPGKRGLKQDAALLDSEAMQHAYAETLNRVVRDARVAYYDLALIVASQALIEKNQAIVRQLLKVADARYAVGQGNQVDVLRGQTQLSKLSEELLGLQRDYAMYGAELARVLGRDSAGAPMEARLEWAESTPDVEALREQALKRRPQLLALESIVERNRRSIELARLERYPDFDVRLSYGQRDRMPDGERRSDMISLTVAMNLPIWERTNSSLKSTLV